MAELIVRQNGKRFRYNPDTKVAVPLEETAPKVEEPKTVESGSSQGEAFRSGLKQGATFGFQEEMEAPVVKAIGAGEELAGRGIKSLAEMIGSEKLSQKGSEMIRRGGFVGDIPKEDLIAESRAKFEKEQAQYPWTTLAGQAMGGAAMLAPSTPALAAAPITTSIGLGALSGLGASEKKNVEQALVDAGIGGAFGLATGGVAKGLTSAAPVLKGFANSLGRRALGMIKSVNNKIGGPEKAKKTVEVLLNNKAIKGSLQEVADTIFALKESAGQVIGDTLESLDKAGAGNIFDPKKLAEKLRTEKVPGTTMTVDDLMNLSMSSGIRRQYQEIIESAQQFGKGGFRAAQDFKQLLKERINFAKDVGEKNLFLRAYHVVSNAIDEGVEVASVVSGDKAIRESFRAAKELYSAAKNAEVGIDSSLRSATGNRIFSLTDWVVLGGQDPVTGTMMTLGKKALESTRALGAGARMSRGLAGAIEKAGPAAAGNIQAASPGLAGRIVQEQ